MQLFNHDPYHVIFTVSLSNIFTEQDFEAHAKEKLAKQCAKQIE